MSLDERKRVSAGYRIGLLYRLQSSLLERRLEKYGICVGQLPYLKEILDRPGLHQGELSQRAGVCRSATARQLATLERNGFIRREENPKNRRQKLVYPTEKAAEMDVPLGNLLAEYNESLFQGFSNRERTMLLGLMDRLRDNIEIAISEWDNL